MLPIQSLEVEGRHQRYRLLIHSGQFYSASSSL